MGKNDDENLFEDLDSFFEPINEVGWPEESGFEVPTTPADPPAPAPVEDEDVAEEEPTEDLGSVEVAAGQADEAGSELSFAGVADETAVIDQDFADEADAEDDMPSGPDTSELIFEGESPSGVIVGVGADQNELITPSGPDAPGQEEVAAASAQDPPGEPQVIQFDEAGLVESEPGLGFLTEDGIAEDEEVAIGGFEPEGDRDIEQEILADLAAPDPEEVGATLADGLTGPSWHEPTHVEVGGDVQERSQPRNMPAAFVTGIGLAAVALVALLISAELFALLAGAGVLLALVEFYNALKKRHLETATPVGLLFGAFILYAGFTHGVAGAAIFLALGFMFSILWEIATPAKFRKHVTVSVGLTMLGLAYIPFLASFGMEILARPGIENVSPSGVVLMIFILGLTFAYDTVAFIAGSMFGEHQLAAQISPKKSIEGAVAGSFAVAILAAALGGLAGLNDVGTSIMFAVVVMIGAPLGDLAESLIKRDLGIKDMGNILPGHGGVLDRIDSLLVVLPLAFLVALGLPFA